MKNFIINETFAFHKTFFTQRKSPLDCINVLHTKEKGVLFLELFTERFFRESQMVFFLPHCCENCPFGTFIWKLFYYVGCLLHFY